MMPISEINEGDIFQNPMYGFEGLMWIVEQVNSEEKMVKVQAYNTKTYQPYSRPIWKKNSDRMFTESWRTYNGATCKIV